MKTKIILTIANRRLTKLKRQMLIILFYRRRIKLIVIMVSVLIKNEVEESCKKREKISECSGMEETHCQFLRAVVFNKKEKK